MTKKIDYEEYVFVTDWQVVDESALADEKWPDYTDDTSKILAETLKHAKKLQAKGELFIAFQVVAVHYIIYTQIEAERVFINRAGTLIMSCPEKELIGNTHKAGLEWKCGWMAEEKG